MELEAFERVAVGDVVYVHHPVPPIYALFLGEVEQKHDAPVGASVYLPELGRTVFCEPDRLHAYPAGDGGLDGSDCPYCRVNNALSSPRRPGEAG